METTVAVSFPQVDGADLVATYNKYSGIPAKAKAQYDTVLANLEYNLTTKPQFDEFINLVSTRKNELNAARTPITKMFDTIRSNFTGLEKDLDALLEAPKLKERQWKEGELTKQRQEEANRNAVAQKVRNLALFPVEVERLLNELVLSSKQRIFKDLTLEVSMNQPDWEQLCKVAANATGCAGYDPVEVGALIKPKKAELWARFDAEISAFTKTVRSATNAELPAIADQIGIEHQQKAQEIIQEKQMAIVEAEIKNVEAATPTGPVIRTKKVCEPLTLDEVGKVFALWLAEVKPTVEEANKMISKAITHATKRANDKTNWLEMGGVNYREDVK